MVAPCQACRRPMAYALCRSRLRHIQSPLSITSAECDGKGALCGKVAEDSFTFWSDTSATLRLDRTLMAHAAKQRDVKMQQDALLDWRRAAARLVRTEALLARETKRVALEQAARKFANALRRAAFRALAAEAKECIHRSKATIALGRVLTRIDKSRALLGWRGFGVWWEAALSRAADAHPEQHARSCLRRWHSITASQRSGVSTSDRALMRLKNQSLAKAFGGWVSTWQELTATRNALMNVARRWRNKAIGAGYRAWKAQVEEILAALASMRRGLAMMRNAGLGNCWRTWSSFAEQSRETRDRMAATVRRLMSRGVSRALSSWIEQTLARQRMEALVTSLSPEGRALRAALNQWIATYAMRLTNLKCIGEALAHKDSRLCRLVLREWLGAAFRAEAERRGLSQTLVALQGHARAFRSWRGWWSDRTEQLEAVRRAGARSFRRDELTAFGAISLAAKLRWLAKTALNRWRDTATANAIVEWREAAATHSDIMGLAKRAIGCLFLKRMPHAWRAWEESVDAMIDARKLARRAANFWHRHGYASAWEFWVMIARAAAAVMSVERGKRRVAFGRLARYSRGANARDAATFAVYAARLGAAIALWRSHAEMIVALRPFWQRAERAKRRTVLSRGVAMMTDVNARLQVWISLECKADEKRTARVLIAWSAWLDDERIVEKKMRWAASKWSKLAERYGFDAWYEEASKRAVLDDCMTRWRQGMVGRAMNTWVAYSVQRATMAFSLGADRRKLLGAALSVWRDNASEGSSDGSDLATGGALTAGGTARTTVVVFGAGAFGQLGHGGEKELVVPTRLAGLGALRVRGAACGDYHTCLLSSDGELFTFGLGEHGVLGHGNEERCTRPRRVEALVGEHAVSAACGWRHTVCLTASGRLYSWGHGGFGQLGHGGLIHFFLPLQIQSGGGRGMGSGGAKASGGWQQVSCGWRHTAAIGDGGIGHTWGDCEHLQLGHGDRKGQTRPRVVEALSGETLRQLECGSHHCAAIGGGGRVYTWGSGSFGQLGHGERRSEAVPRLVGSLAHIEAVRVACGGHTCVLGAHGELYSFGNGKHGQLGHGEPRAEPNPRRVHALGHARILGIACGDFHTLALDDGGNVYTWGAGGHGELGHGNLSHQIEPRRLDSLRRRSLVFAACGASHNVLLLAASGGMEESGGESSSDDESAPESATTVGRVDY